MSNCRCEPKLEGIAFLAEDPAIVVVAYLIVIFPWGIMQNVDFISEKWRTITHTRHLGYLHLAFMLIPLPYIIFYAHLQRISSDYKEMMTAVVVILMCMYHVTRTVWGLIQLESYHVWCKDLAERMLTLEMVKPKKWAWMLQTAEMGFRKRVSLQVGRLFWKKKIEAENSSSEDEIDMSKVLVDNTFTGITSEIERMLKVNNTVVDNELGGTDLAVSLDFNKVGLTSPHKWLTTGEAELATVRWSAAFLCGFGSYWGTSSKNWPGEDEKYLKELFSSCSRSLDTLNYVTFPVSGARTRMTRDYVSPNGVYGSTMESVRFEKKLETRELVMENVASSYPTDDGKDRLALIQLARSLLDIKFTNYASLVALVQYSGTFELSQGPLGWSLLLWQHRELPADLDSPVLNPWGIPPWWKHLMVPLWDVCTNWRVLQASAHKDNRANLIFSKPAHQCISDETCYFSLTRQLGQNAYDVQLNHDFFTGCLFETVRTFLADWLCTRPVDAPDPDWSPVIPRESIELPYNKNHRDLKWECQCLLQETIARMERSDKNMPASPHLIALFILAFPNVKCGQTQRTFHVPFAPQDIKVVVRDLWNNAGGKLVISLVPHDSVRKFNWADWIDAAMGCITANMFNVPVLSTKWRKRTPSKCDLSRPLLKISKGHSELPNLPGDIRIWTGWPFFDIKVVHFEMDQWLQAAGYLQGFCDVARPTVQCWEAYMRIEADRAEEGLLKIMEWNRI